MLEECLALLREPPSGSVPLAHHPPLNHSTRPPRMHAASPEGRPSWRLLAQGDLSLSERSSLGSHSSSVPASAGLCGKQSTHCSDLSLTLVHNIIGTCDDTPVCLCVCTYIGVNYCM